MKTTNFITSFILFALLQGCFAPINSTFESARLLKVGEAEYQGHYSGYYFLGTDYNSGISNCNFGLSVSAGVTERYNIRFRYERLNIVPYNYRIGSSQYFVSGSSNYLEFGNKFVSVVGVNSRGKAGWAGWLLIV